MAANNDVDKREKQSPKLVVAMADFVAEDNTQLSFNEGDEMTILSESSSVWWWAELDEICGYVPVSYVVPVSEYLSRHTQNHDWQDEEYFGAYGKVKIHLEMLSDHPRTLAYRNAIQKHRDVFIGKTVLDVGCGSGILSLFCAKDGKASKVYAVDGSVDIGELTKELVERNDLHKIITVITGKIEEIELPEKVDIIISEWMGTFLVFEFMIDTVLYARDRWLKPDGVIWPSNAKLFVVPCCAEEAYKEKVTAWNNQYGFDFSPFLNRAKTEVLNRPLHNHELDPRDCLSQRAVLLDIDMSTFVKENLELMSENFEFVISKEGTLHGLCSWFSVTFGGIPITDTSECVILSTAPDQEQTHWKQNLFLLEEPVTVHVGNFIEGSATLRRNPKYRRHMNVTFEFNIFTSDSKGEIVYSNKKKYFIWR